jgi:hypothetical protein
MGYASDGVCVLVKVNSSFL